ncbi:hypothetical protein BJ944DRAFT_231387 [Cunninghamella echinulata]|nr:hypothetical protein BJ944DRAFT_231387 [Cunninghamella echinulata]
MSYISSLNLLNSDSPAPITEDTFSDDLSLWANAQFTFDCAPGSALIEEDKKQENETLLSSLSDFNLEQQQQQQQQSINTPSYITTLLSQVQQQQTIPQTTINQINLPRIAPATEQFQSTAALQVGDTGVAKVKIETINNNNNNKRPSQQEQEDTSHTLSPEDDKRRRNTAASARFRQKKKLREQALEQTAKEMSTKCDTLEKRVRELEMEAKWLRALVIEKNPSLLSDKSSVAVADEPSPSSTS